MQILDTHDKLMNSLDMPIETINEIKGCRYNSFDGLDLVRDGNNAPIRKTRKHWQSYANKEAKKLSKKDGLLYEGHVCWVDTRGTYRVNIAANYSVKNS